MKTQVAIGPELPEFGSWQWIGQDLVKGLSASCEVATFSDPENVPAAEITVFLKFKPPLPQLEELTKHTHPVFMPVDVYGSVNEIESDRGSLRLFDLIIVHSHRLIRHFNSTARTEYLDHALRYVTNSVIEADQDGHILWVGRRCNIAPVVEWCNQIELGRELLVLTNTTESDVSPVSIGFHAKNQVTVREWSAREHIQALRCAALAVDIKGTDFRARHKPPAKVLDFLASGIPVMINRGGSADLHLWTLGFTGTYADDNLPKTFESTECVRKLAERLRSSHSLESVSRRFSELMSSVGHRRACSVG